MDRFFFAPPEAFSSTGYIAFPPDEAKHAIKVLRLRPGDTVTVVDGQGLGVRVQIECADRDGVRGRIVSKHENLGEPVRKLTIGLALLKQQKRYNFFLEKAVELGVTGIIPLMTERTESRIWRKDRAMQVMIAALKQCERSRLPELHPPMSFDQLLDSRPLIADPGAEASLLEVVREMDDSTTILIGPEGGFTEDERRLAIMHDGKLVQLGSRRLRAETAAICCAAAVMFAGHSRNSGRAG